jgi:oxygen-independent coproporphyrinogen-3 oxidase
MSPSTINLAKYADIEQKDIVFEFMMNALRLSDGVKAHLFSARTGLDLTYLEPVWSDLKKQGLMVDNFATIATTPTGSIYLNSVLEKFLD